MNASLTKNHELSLAGRRVALVGKLSSMSRRDAERLIREHGGRVVEKIDAEVDVVVAGDEASDWNRLLSDRQAVSDETRAALAAGGAELLRESELWARLGLVDAGPGVERLYTAAMLAELVGMPVRAIRQWQRQGALRPSRQVRRLAYFDFEEVAVARKLAQLVAAGCSLSAIGRKLDELGRLLPGAARPLADPAVVVEGRCLYVRRGESLTEPSGQLLIDFDAPRGEQPTGAVESEPVAIPFASAAERFRGALPGGARAGTPLDVEELRDLAEELEETGRRDQAIDVYRAILVSGQFAADDHFELAELLYREADLSAARERYYVAIELDEDFVEARSNLGCVLAEQGDVELAEAAFRGALEFHPDYADAHYHLARLLDRIGRAAEALAHWQRFMRLAPESPWADEARDRIAVGGE